MPLNNSLNLYFSEFIMSLSNVCLILDMDGFFINKKFHAREVGYVSLTENRSDSYRFKLNHLAVKLSEKDWKTVHYCRKYIHGLTLKCLPWEKNLHHVKNLRELLKNTYYTSKREDRNFVAYKGGRIEKDILDELGIPSINLEDFGCPKYEELPSPSVPDCGYHVHMNESIHCPIKECVAFSNWIKKHQQKSDSEKSI